MTRLYAGKGQLVWLMALFMMMAANTKGAAPPPERAEMLETIRESVRESASYTGRAQLSTRVEAAMAAVPREEFVPPAYRHLAHQNTPLPIEAGQTISQPLIVALMTDMLDPQAGDVVLEVGTGSGYQAAVLAELVQQVYSV